MLLFDLVLRLLKYWRAASEPVNLSLLIFIYGRRNIRVSICHFYFYFLLVG